ENRMGHVGYLAFYLLCGVVAVGVHYWSAPNSLSPMVGASGAIAGVLGAYMVSFPRAKIVTLLPLIFLIYLIEVPAYLFLGLWFLLQFLQGSIVLICSAQTQTGNAWWAHLGGFGSGILLLPFFCKWIRKPLLNDRCFIGTKN
ncbi:MAG: rhomboid family intramembrane serine protease, partial [Deltaproteobacteria bacterium]